MRKSSITRAPTPLLAAWLLVFAGGAEATDAPRQVDSTDQQDAREVAVSAQVGHSLANVSVIRAALRDEVAQKPHMMFSARANVAALLIGIRDRKSGVIERKFVASTTERGPPKRKVRGAELAPGAYTVSVNCVGFSANWVTSNSFEIEVDAEAGSEYVFECVGYPKISRKQDWEAMHPVVTRKPLLTLVNGVTALSEKCVSNHDVPLWDRILAPKCTEAKK
jgi:hypothetical protein